MYLRRSEWQPLPFSSRSQGLQGTLTGYPLGASQLTSTSFLSRLILSQGPHSSAKTLLLRWTAKRKPCRSYYNVGLEYQVPNWGERLVVAGTGEAVQQKHFRALIPCDFQGRFPARTFELGKSAPKVEERLYNCKHLEQFPSHSVLVYAPRGPEPTSMSSSFPMTPLVPSHSVAGEWEMLDCTCGHAVLLAQDVSVTGAAGVGNEGWSGLGVDDLARCCSLEHLSCRTVL
jgi:hypothetical protein